VTASGRARVQVADFASAFAFADALAASPRGGALALAIGWGWVEVEGSAGQPELTQADARRSVRWPPLPAAVCAPASGLAAEPFVLPRAGDAVLTPAARSEALATLPCWAVRDGRLTRTVAVEDPARRWALARRLGALAESLGHHPVLRLTAAALEVQLWTEDVGGLTRADLVWAARADLLIAS
jgi:4a-hydroxytetrahydrobiopterin dehydratase